MLKEGGGQKTKTKAHQGRTFHGLGGEPTGQRGKKKVSGDWGLLKA